MKIGQTTKQKLYLEEVLRLHREKGYGEDRISRIIPIGHTTVSRWITKFATANQQNLVQMKKNESRVKEQSRLITSATKMRCFSKLRKKSSYCNILITLGIKNTG